MQPARPAKETDYFIDVPPVGKFRFGRETLADHIAIAAKYTELTGGNGDKSNYLSAVSNAVAHLSVLCVSAPEKWQDAEAVLFDNETGAELITIGNALMERINSFRNGAAKDGQKARLGAGAELSELVPADV